MDAVVQLLNAQSAADECAAWTSLLHQWAANDQLVLQMAAQPPVLSSLSDSEASAHQQQSPPVLSSMLEEFLLFFIAHAVSKVPDEPIATRANHDVLAGFVARWSPGEAHEGDELARHLANLKGKLTQCQWNGDALHQLVYVLSLLQEPCLRQETLRFSFTIIQHTLSSSANMPPLRTTMLSSPCESNTQQVYEKCSELMLLGVTDIWSAIRKESAKHTAMLVLQFPTMGAIDGFVERLLRIAVGSEHVRQETSVQTRWGEQDGALHALSLLLSSIRIKKRAVKEVHHSSQASNSTSNVGAASRVASDIRGGFAAAAMASAPALRFSFGSHHPSVPRLPRSLVQSLKPVLYQCLRHEQLSVREQAAQCLKHYVDLCEEPMQLLIFQEAMSKLNRMKESATVGVCSSSGDDHELLEAFEAEGLLDVLAKLAPSLPSSFLLKHWKFVFPTLDRYVMHIASSVRQKSSAVVLSLAKLSQSDCGAQTAVPLAASFDSGSSHGAALELLVEMMLGLSASQGHESTAAGGGAIIHCWQQREGRMLSIEALVDLLGKDLLFRKFGAHLLNGSASEQTKKSQAPVLKAKVDLAWASSSASSSTWTLDEDELAELTALSQRSKQADACGKTEIANQPLVSALSAFLTGKKSTRGGKSLGATKFWCRVLSGWLQQTQIAFGSNQFELRRISRQLLPGLLRLSLWTNQLGLLQSQRIYIIEESGECWRWSCVKFLLLHVQFLQESIQMHSVGGEDEELTGVLQTGLESAWSLTSAVSKDKLESTGGGSYGTESTTVRVEAQLMTFLSFSRSDDKEISSLGLLESGLVTVHANLPPHMQLPQYITPGRPSDEDTSSLDRQLSISLVRLLPSIARELGLVFTKHNSQGGVASGHEMRMTKCWLILERVVLTWLVTEDMFRWITVDQNEAQLSLLKALSGLLQCIPAKRSEHFSSLEVDLELVLKQLERIGVLVPGKNQQHRSTESILTHALRICLSLWKNSVRGDDGESTIEARCCQGVIQVYAQLAALNDSPNLSSLTKSSTSQSEISSWDDWDEDEYEPGELGNNKMSQLRVTASVDELVGGGGVAEQLFSDAVSGWSGDQLSALHASISASTVAHTHVLLPLVDSLRS